MNLEATVQTVVLLYFLVPYADQKQQRDSVQEVLAECRDIMPRSRGERGELATAGRTSIHRAVQGGGRLEKSMKHIGKSWLNS